jgi:hypothetical protein
MDYNKSVFKREAWGTKPCNHPTKEAEYFMGQNTGKTVCTVCGKLFLSAMANQTRTTVGIGRRAAPDAIPFYQAQGRTSGSPRVPRRKAK